MADIAMAYRAMAYIYSYGPNGFGRSASLAAQPTPQHAELRCGLQNTACTVVAYAATYIVMSCVGMAYIVMA